MTEARAVAVLLAALALSGCSGWLGGSEEEKLAGERVSILDSVSVPSPDAQVANVAVTLPEQRANANWSQEGGEPGHAVRHAAASGGFAALWRGDAGAGTGGGGKILGQPVISGGRVFTIDAEATVSAFDAGNGDPLWQASLVREGDDDEGILGGGLAVAAGRVFATTGFSHVISLSAEDGAEIWRKALNAPLRAAPTVSGGRVFVLTVADELFALDAGDGRELWSYPGLSEAARLVGAAAPAAGSGIVVAPYSSGEIAALRVENGRVVWTESLAAVRRSDAVSSLAHIRGWPVIDRGVVYVVSHAGRTMAVDLRTGNRLWVAPVGGVHGPWAAGDFVYVMTGTAALVCLTRRGGLVRWVRQLPRYEDEEDREGEILWTGPVLAGGRLVVANSNGEILFLSPRDGEVAGRAEAPGPVLISPAVAGETLYVLTEDASLIALR